MLTVDNANLHYGAAQALRGISIKAEMARMEGTWTFEKIVTLDGNSPPADELKEMRLEVKGDTRLVKRGDEVTVKSTYKIDPKASPKTIDVTIVEGPEQLKGKTLYGIYELDGDTFKVCLTADMPEMQHPGLNRVAKEAPGGRYEAEFQFGMGGNWKTAVTIAEPGKPVVSAPLTISVEEVS